MSCGRSSSGVGLGARLAEGRPSAKESRPIKPPTSCAVTVVTSLLTPAPEKQEELLQTLRSLKVEIAREPGCVQCAVYRDVEGGGHVLLVSEWRDPASLREHLASEDFRVLAGASRLLGASADFRFVTSHAVVSEEHPSPEPQGESNAHSE